ncbi:MAG: hypothetical protein AABX71_01145, partial [Nanoarchaeota archaeon]
KKIILIVFAISLCAFLIYYYFILNYYTIAIAEPAVINTEPAPVQKLLRLQLLSGNAKLPAFFATSGAVPPAWLSFPYQHENQQHLPATHFQAFFLCVHILSQQENLPVAPHSFQTSETDTVFSYSGIILKPFMI